MSNELPEAGLDTPARILSISPAVLRDLADEIEKDGMANLVIADAVTGEVERYEVSDFDVTEWAD